MVGEGGDVTVCRISRTLIDGDVSRLGFEYLIGPLVDRLLTS